VGGHVQAGETYEAAAAREMAEEINLAVPLTYIGTLFSDEIYTDVNYRHMYALYTAIAPSTWKFIPNDEVEDLLKKPLNKVIAQMASQPRKFTAGFLRCMQYYCTKKNLKFPLDLTQYKIDRQREA
jgi:ADP-ribose pyrophosphatase YjhB (NUDIX family)